MKSCLASMLCFSSAFSFWIVCASSNPFSNYIARRSFFVHCSPRFRSCAARPPRCGTASCVGCTADRRSGARTCPDCWADRADGLLYDSRRTARIRRRLGEDRGHLLVMDCATNTPLTATNSRFCPANTCSARECRECESLERERRLLEQ